MSTHRLHGAVEMRATTMADRVKAIAARVDATGRATDDDLRCARALAEKLGVR